jgi:exopolyphosphatase/guanosine-5'-triphosphate,3'-diphosphate pyrophosphatase
MEIISGDQEAEWVFRGVTSDPRLHGRKLLILDVGGGSTEFIFGEHDHHSFRQSFPVGSVRLLENFIRAIRPPFPIWRDAVSGSLISSNTKLCPR